MIRIGWLVGWLAGWLGCCGFVTIGLGPLDCGSEGGLLTLSTGWMWSVKSNGTLFFSLHTRRSGGGSESVEGVRGEVRTGGDKRLKVRAS